jgi:hypothetical protein
MKTKCAVVVSSDQQPIQMGCICSLKHPIFPNGMNFLVKRFQKYINTGMSYRKDEKQALDL